MADNEVEEDLFADLYDGEADDPPAPVKAEPEETKPEPEPMQQHVKTEEPKVEAGDDFNIKPEPDYNTGGGGGGGDVYQGGQYKQEDRDDDYNRPINIKDDGYV